MKAAVLLSLALASAAPAFSQVTARHLTRNVAPQPQQQPPPRPAAQYTPAPAPAQRPMTAKEVAKVKADKSKNEVKQFEFFKRRAEEGSDHAQFELGMRYLNGKGTDPDEKVGREWLAKSAKQGYTKASKALDDLGPAPAAAAPAAKVEKSAEPKTESK